MKKFLQKMLIICLCLTLAASLAACGRESAPIIEEGRLNVICTVFPAYDFARTLAGDRANVSLLIPPGAESHSYEPTPQDMASLSCCDLIIANGGVGENWLESLLEAGEVNAPVVYMLHSVSLIEEEHKEGMQNAAHAHEHDDSCAHEHEHEADAGHGAEYDEHVWTSPKNAAHICTDISAALCGLDPAGESYYKERLDTYSQQLLDLDSTFRETVDAAGHRSMIFADRFPVRYFVEEYGLDYYAAFPGCAEDTEPSARTVAFLIDRVREQGIGAVYFIEFSNEKMADVIVEDTGCKKLLFHSCHNVSTQELESGVTYLALMEQNLENLKEGLG